MYEYKSKKSVRHSYLPCLDNISLEPRVFRKQHLLPPRGRDKVCEHSTLSLDPTLCDFTGYVVVVTTFGFCSEHPKTAFLIIRLNYFAQEMIRHDMAQLHITEGMALDRWVWRMHNRVEGFALFPLIFAMFSSLLSSSSYLDFLHLSRGSFGNSLSTSTRSQPVATDDGRCADGKGPTGFYCLDRQWKKSLFSQIILYNCNSTRKYGNRGGLEKMENGVKYPQKLLVLGGLQLKALV
ncbi:hypothetical protein MTR67_024125 [Solanum verrucosum]|uniref:Uncharacterized protein n=1 Tax=Solanum verrucosum TaxID=315347 RepID=A0AAF0QXU2_SOLVR|nr:hypothetical protein MTR67_024125 [Solanum verrucosum]